VTPVYITNSTNTNL